MSEIRGSGSEDVPRRRFGPFTFDPESLRLLRGGRPVDLQPQPARILKLLTDKPGRLVRRKELEERIWSGTSVDFDKAVGFALLKLRRSLGDDARAPRYVETLPRVGYRFIAEVSESGQETAPVPAPPRGEGPPRCGEASSARSGRGGMGLLALSGIACLLVAAVFLGARGGSGVAPRDAAGPPAGEARELAELGRRLLKRGSEFHLRRSAGIFEEALSIDPHSAGAWAALGTARLRLHLLAGTAAGPARAALERALRIDPGLARAHMTLGDVLVLVDRDPARAGQAYRRALELEPALAEAHSHLATLRLMEGRTGEALAAIRTALELEPASAILAGEAGWIHFFARDYGEARRLCRLSLRVEPRSRHALACVMEASRRLGEAHDAASAAMDLADLLGAGEEARAAMAAAAPEEALRIFHRIHPALLAEQSLAPGLFDLPRAHSFAARGLHQEALAALERASREGRPGVLLAGVDPRFDALRRDPRFRSLVGTQSAFTRPAPFSGDMEAAGL